MASEDIIKLDSSSDEDEPQPQKKENEIEQGDNPNVQDMDLGDDVIVSKKSILDASAELVTSGPTCRTVINYSADVILIDESPMTAVKRSRVEYTDNEPSVRVVFSFLTRESKRKLMELMLQWSEWQAKHPSSSSSSKETQEEASESGEETYYPALHVGCDKSKTSTVSFWLDNQARADNVKDESSIPLYDREFKLGSSSLDGSATFQRSGNEEPRCFNCGSYSHSMKECPKPRDVAAISSARKQHNTKRNLFNVNQGQNRYYQRKPGQFDDLKPGVLGSETRECLGIGEFDPPPWLHRMREIGYPPGYLEIVEDKNKPSGITIFTDKEEKDNSIDKKEEYEDGELPEQSEPGSPEKRMTVEFPGINALIPEKADTFLWSVNPPRIPAPSYPPRYNSYDQYNGSSSRSPNLGKSLSDRGRYDGSSSHSPHSSSTYLYQYSTSSPDLPIYLARDREREGERDRDRKRHDHRRHHHHRR